jgi:hypothetical protein
MHRTGERTGESSAKLQVYIPQSLRDDIDAAAASAGQTLSMFITRTPNAALRASGGVEKQ